MCELYDIDDFRIKIILFTYFSVKEVLASITLPLQSLRAGKLLLDGGFFLFFFRFGRSFAHGGLLGRGGYSGPTSHL